MSNLESFQQLVTRLWRGVCAPRFYVLLLGSPILWTLSYQQKSSYTVDVGGLRDDAFVAGFHGKERNSELDYRWSLASSTVLFPGIGNQPVTLSLRTVGFRPDGAPPAITVQARGKAFTVQTAPGLHTDSLVLDRGDPLDGSLRVTLLSPVFTTPTDARELGVIVDSVTVTPVDYGLRPLDIPPPDTMLGMLLAVIVAYLVSLITLARVQLALVVGATLSLLFALLILLARPELGLLAAQLPGLGAWAVLLAVGGRLLLDALVTPKRGHASAVAGMGSAAFVAAFVLRFGGLTYPQFMSSDLLFQVHRMQRVLGGEWVFPSALPDGTVVPYPPALYLILSPLGLVFGRSDETLSLVLKGGMALLDAATCLGLAWAGWRLWGGRAGAVAALVYAVSPAPFELFSAGNYTNLFAQGVLNLTLLGCLVYLNGRGVRRTWVWVGVLSAGFVLTMLGHYGMMLGTLPIVGFFGAWTIVEALRGKRPQRAWLLLYGYVFSIAASFALYYWHFIQDIWNQFSDLASRLGSRTGQSGTGQGALPLQQARLYDKLAGKVSSLVGIPATLAGLFGLTLRATGRRRANAGSGAHRVDRQAHALLASWMGVAVLFLLLDQTLGDAVRWYYLAAAGVALLAGRFLGRLLSGGWAARLLVGLLLSIMLLQLLNSWVGDQIFTRYHDSWP